MKTAVSFALAASLSFGSAAATLPGTAPQSISKQQLLYDYDEMLNFDLKQYLQQHAPHLLDHVEAISHYAGYSSISPKLLLALMEQQSAALSKPHTADQLQQPFANLSTRQGFVAQLADVSNRLTQAFYQGHAYHKTGKNEKHTSDKDAQRAIEQLFTDQHLSRRSPQATELTQQDSRRLTALYNRLFSQVANDSDTLPPQHQAQPTQVQSGDIADINQYFQLPFPTGEYWRNGGSHTHSGSGSYPQSSLDFNRGGNWGDNLSYIWVAAAAPGVVKYHSSCFMEIIHQDGWSTTYYHLSNIQYGTGAYIERDVPIANYASYKGQALCNGGASSGPHLHFSMKKNGQYYHLNGMRFSGYAVQAGRSSYDDSCSYFWLAKDGYRYCAWSRIYNAGVSQSVPPDNTNQYSGYLAHRASQIQPDGSWFSYSGGRISASLTGPANADFDLRLEQWNGYNWHSVAVSETPSSAEQLSYQAGSGYFRLVVLSYAGAGNYQLTLSR